MEVEVEIEIKWMQAYYMAAGRESERYMGGYWSCGKKLWGREMVLDVGTRRGASQLHLHLHGVDLVHEMVGDAGAERDLNGFGHAGTFISRCKMLLYKGPV